MIKHGAQCFIYAISFNPHNNPRGCWFAFRICLTDAESVPHRGVSNLPKAKNLGTDEDSCWSRKLSAYDTNLV